MNGRKRRPSTRQQHDHISRIAIVRGDGDQFLNVNRRFKDFYQSLKLLFVDCITLSQLQLIVEAAYRGGNLLILSFCTETLYIRRENIRPPISERI